jgi:cytochrome c553
MIGLTWVYAIMRDRTYSCRRWVCRSRVGLWLLLACHGLASAATAQTPASLEVRSLAASCAACHGTDGRSPPGSSMPSLAGLPTTYFISRMRTFRDDARLARSVMAQIAKGYDDQQVNELAEYFASHP